MVEDAHNALGKELEDLSRIKSRLMVAEECVVGNDGISGAMVHVTLLLLEGRDIKTKNAYGKAIYNAVQTHLESMPKCKLTLEVRDMTKENYIL